MKRLNTSVISLYFILDAQKVMIASLTAVTRMQMVHGAIVVFVMLESPILGVLVKLMVINLEMVAGALMKNVMYIVLALLKQIQKIESINTK